MQIDDRPAKDRLAIALDTDDLVVAQRLAKEVQPHVGVAKVGLELYSATGPDAVGTLLDMGFKVFLDLKLHDIPTTVGRSSRVLGALGASYLTLHAHGGVDMLRAGVEGLSEGAAKADLPAPKALAVTILSHDADAPPHILPKRVKTALEAGCEGIVCSAQDASEARHYGPRLEIVTPGIRPEGADHHDQANPATPGDAIEGGADLIVVGRPITQASDPAKAAAAIAAEVEAALAASR